MAKDERIGSDTLQLDETFTDDFVPISDNEPEEFIPTEETGGDEQRYEKAEKALEEAGALVSISRTTSNDVAVNHVISWSFFEFICHVVRL